MATRSHPSNADTEFSFRSSVTRVPATPFALIQLVTACPRATQQQVTCGLPLSRAWSSPHPYAYPISIPTSRSSHSIEDATRYDAPSLPPTSTSFSFAADRYLQKAIPFPPRHIHIICPHCQPPTSTRPIQSFLRYLVMCAVAYPSCTYICSA